MNRVPTTEAVEWDPFAPPADPWPVYRAMRDTRPVFHNPERDIWALSRYADVKGALLNWEIFSYAQGVDIDEVGNELDPGFFVAKDPPIHTAMRGALKHFFQLGPLRERFTPIVAAEVDGLLQPLRERHGTFDIGADFAWMLPIRISAHMLGFPLEDCDRVRALADAAFFLSPPQLPIADSAVLGARGLRDYFSEQIEQRRRAPQDDLLTHIATATIGGEPSGDAAAGMASVLFVGAYATTALSFTSAVHLLAHHPDQRQWLIDNPDATPAAAEEVVRYETPGQASKRTVTAPTELHGVSIPAGAAVVLLFGSANRDERQFERADEFDIRRKPTRHAGFGEGIHFCIGAPLARLELDAAIRALLVHAPAYELTGNAKEIPPMDRGFLSLEIAW